MACTSHRMPTQGVKRTTMQGVPMQTTMYNYLACEMLHSKGGVLAAASVDERLRKLWVRRISEQQEANPRNKKASRM